MAEPDEDTCGQEDCVAAVPATQLEAAADGEAAAKVRSRVRSWRQRQMDAAAGTSDEAVAAAPEGCNSLGGDKERSLDAEEEKRGVFAVKLGGCWDAVSVKLEGGDWAGEGKEKVCSADEENRGGIAVEFGGHAESNGMATCCVVNGVMGDELSCTPCGEGFGSDDVGCARNTLHDAAEGSQCKQVGLEGEGDDAEVKMGGEDLWTGEEVRGNKVDLFDSGNIEGEGLTCGSEDVASTADACREVERDDLLLKMDAEVEGPVDEASIPSISGSCIVVSLDCKACRVDDISENSKGMGKSACGSEGGGVLFRKSVFREDCCVEKNQHSRMEILQRMALFKTKEANLKSLKACVDGRSAEVEVSLQLTDQKDGGSEYSPERELISSSHSQPCEDAPCCSGEELRAQHQSCQDAAGVGCAPSGHVVMELNASNSAEAKACSGSFADNADIGESIDPKPAPLIVFRRRNPKRAASSRNTQNLDKLNMARNGTGKLKKAVGASSLLLSAMVKFPNKTTKRRSGMNRPLQYPVWGSLQNLIDSFSQNCKVLVSDSDPTWLGNERSKKRSDGKIKPCIRKSRTSRVPKSKFAVFCALGRGKDALSGQPTFPVMADTQASSEKDHKKLIPSLASDVSITASDEAAKASESNEDKNILKIKSAQSDRQQLERDLESTVTQETHSIRGECTTLSASELSLKNGNGTIMLDPGSSPDSVVYNPVLEVASVTCESNTSANHDVVVHGSLFDASSEDGLPTGVLPASNFSKKHSMDSSGDLEQQAKTERVNKSTNKVEIGPSCNMLEKHIDEGKVQASEKLNAVRKHKNLKNQGCKKKDGVREKSSKSRSSTKVCSAKASKLKASNHSSMVDPLELLLHKGSPKLDSCFEASTSSEQDLGTRLHEHDNVGHPFLTDNAKQDLGSMTSLASRHKKKNGHGGRKGKKQGSHTKGENKNKFILDNALHDHEYLSLSSQAVTQLAASALNEQSKLNAARGLSFENFVAMSTELPNKAACGLDGASVPPPLHAAWVCCDDCQKWRCIPAELADIIRETNRRWTCKDNEDKAFAGCSIPQEKTNAEINAELELSDASADEACNAESNSRACKPPSWTPLRSNLFLHRNRRTQSIDESMICNCKPPEDGQMGCRDGCLNRILNIECVKRTCPCGYLCSNQQFQRRNYAKLRWFHSGKKGYGLQLRENVSEGQFLIEYVGEVLDITAYESRQRYYASKGQKHFYFMALNGGEVIDACTKGNLGRFINHSCSPNCRTEKWMVNGEVCIGIFATRNIKKGEELTFDYNYVRVSGAAPQKCFCGAAKCRGYIGGDILDAGMIAQGDAEAVYFAPASVDRDTKKEPGAKELSSHDSYLDVVQHEETSMQREDINDCFYAMPKLEPHQQTGGNLSDISSEPDNSLQAFSPEEDDGIIRTPVHVSRTMESSLQHFPLPNNQPAEFLQTTPICVNALAPSRPGTDVQSSTLVSDFHVNEEKKLKHHSNLKRSSPVDNLKDSIAGSKTLLLHKDKTMPTDTGNDHLLGVEGRLNKLLDADGGISKRKDATNGYLKLLLVTAAEGDNAGGTSKSVRDLSLILDALLKTKSHAVLLDIINKNGLQMLHNILKQNRGNFHRTPIIRKLLKVLEFLALKGILTPERINGGPQCAGKESFRDSMMRLTRHNDSQVHQIARNFRDKWMPRTITRSEPTEREDGHLQSHWSYLDKLQMPLANCQHDQGKRESDAVVCVDAAACPPASSSAQDIQGISSAGEPALVSTCTDRNATGRRKRKSRWDQPSEDHYKLIGLKIQKPCFERTEYGPQIGFMRNKLQTNWETDGPMRGSIAESVDDDVPPGFGSQQECHHFPAQITSESSGVAPGYRQERYQAHLNISYGIPIELVQQFGTPEIGGGQHPNSWRIAPGVPFHPFPPLPPYPQGETCPSTSSSQIFQHDAETITVKHNSSGHYQRSADRDGRAHRNWQNGGRGRWSSDYQGRRIPRQWNNHHRFDRYRPSWPREHVALGSRGRE